MSEPAFDTLDAARRLETAGFETGRAEAIVEVMRKSVHQLVTREHFDAVIGKLDARIDAVEANLGARIDKLDTRIDAVQAELGARIDKLDTRIDAVQAELGAQIGGVETRIMRAMLIAVSVLIAAMALMMMVAGIFLA